MRGHVHCSRIIALPQGYPVLKHRNPHRVRAVVHTDAQVAPAEHYGTRAPRKDVERTGNTSGRTGNTTGSLCLAHGSGIEYNGKK